MSRVRGIAIIAVAAAAVLSAPRGALAKPTSPRRVPAAAAGEQDRPPWLGLLLEAGSRGVRVTEVISGTPASRAGVAVSDEILAIDGRRVLSPDELVAAVGTRRSGDRTKLSLVRGTRQLIVSAVLAPKPDPEEIEESRTAQWTAGVLDRPAPAFDLPVVAGVGHGAAATTSLAKLRGKVVVVEYLGAWCGPCKTTYDALGVLARKRAGDGLVVLGISDEEEAALLAVADHEHIGFPILRDAASAVRRAYGVRATPTFLVIDRAGMVRFAAIGIGSPPGITTDNVIFAAERALDARGQRD